jgi:hypothetical protein
MNTTAASTRASATAIHIALLGALLVMPPYPPWMPLLALLLGFACDILTFGEKEDRNDQDNSRNHTSPDQEL